MYAILGEDQSDAEMIHVLIRGLAKNQRLKAKLIGFGGCSQMLIKGATLLRSLSEDGYTRFIVCLDADGDDPNPQRSKAQTSIITPSGLANSCCLVVPVQEIEAWILADIEAVNRIFPSWSPAPIPNPEGIQNPKEALKRLSREGKTKPRYIHAVHNPQVAKKLDLATVERKCPSFRVLAEFVRGRPAAPKRRKGRLR